MSVRDVKQNPISKFFSDLGDRVVKRIQTEVYKVATKAIVGIMLDLAGTVLCSVKAAVDNLKDDEFYEIEFIKKRSEPEKTTATSTQAVAPDKPKF